MDYYNNKVPTILSKFINNKQYIEAREVKNFHSYATTKSFKDICFKRIQSIVKNKGDRKITLLWSGGLDSTLLFYLLLSTNVEFDMVMTEMSEVEHFDLYHDIDNYTHITKIVLTSEEFMSHVSKYDKEKDLVITGDNGDQTFMSNLPMKYFKDVMHLPYRIVIPKDVYESVSEHTDKVIYNKVNATVANWCWALDFVYRWDVVNSLLSYELGFTLDNTPLVSFFHTDDFANYSVTNQVKNSKYDMYSDKCDMRKLIIRLCPKDENYVKNKTKVGSQKMFYFPKDYKRDYYA